MSTFQRTTRAPVALQPEASTLRTEVVGDGRANCLEQASRLARPGDSVVLLRDSRDPVGHAIVQRRDGSVVDPRSPQVTYPDMGSWQAANPQYHSPVKVPAQALQQVLAQPPGPQRDAALSQLGLNGVADRRVADGPAQPHDPELVGLERGREDGTLDPPGPVQRLQNRLIELGVVTGGDVETMRSGRGTFGTLTEGALKRFQEQQYLPVTGEVDELTAQRLANPLRPADIARQEVPRMRQQVYERAYQEAMDRVPAQTYRRLPPEDQAAIRAEAERAGHQAVARFNRDMNRLVDQELQQAGLSREQINRLPPEDREELLAGPTLAALRRFDMAQQALSRSAAQMDPETATMVNSNNRLSVKDDPKAWNNFCLAFVSSSYGRQAEQLKGGSAIEVANRAVENGDMQTDRDYRNWPAGAPVFFEATSNNGYAGHVAIFTGRFDENGEPLIRTSMWGSHEGIQEVPLSYLEQQSGALMGYLDYPDT